MLQFNKPILFRSLLYFVISTFLFGCAHSQKTSHAVSSAEVAAGEALHEQIMKDFKPYTNPALNEYLQGITTRLSTHAKRKNLSYRITILNDERIYAVAAPGGDIYITTAFLSFLKNEAELAAVIAHEIGELQFLAPQFNPVRKTLDGVSKVTALVAPVFGQIGVLASMGIVGLHAAYARDPSLESRVLASDRFTMQSMLKEGYDPQALVDVLTHFAKYDREALSLFYDYYQSRPITIKRVNAANEEFKKLNLEGQNLETFFERYQKNTQNLQSAAN